VYGSDWEANRMVELEKINFVSELGTPLFTSRSSQVFLLENNKLLKLFFNHVTSEQVDVEVINTQEAFEKGVTKVECFGKYKIEDRYGMLMRKVDGKTLICIFTRNPLFYFKAYRIMADLHLQLHNTKTEKIRDYKKLAISCLDTETFDFLSVYEKNKISEYIKKLPDGNSILHLDYHPDNLMYDGKTATIIDWMTAARGVPAADMATTAYLLKEGEMIPGCSAILNFVLEVIRKGIFKSYFKRYQKVAGISDFQIEEWRLVTLIVRLSVWHIESEIDILQKKIRNTMTALNL